ncbi:hypothetical protein GCM10010260_62400 [Streptomyces filipinensis]|uniref:Uncharacterized protein n=1 Tax=Streptomyces filipinensis TaxID=66887 RepID=A0A918IHS8_9ACTN|nr:hypothetical protein [Streptomyces filipinensis]GGV14700.1 hypothetical protein GCM10010260_62400 [Streptomyces filipinensis]
MDDVTAHPSEKPTLPYAETGWAKAHRRRGWGVRTCLPATLERGSAPRQDTACEDTIVRGED